MDYTCNDICLRLSVFHFRKSFEIKTVENSTIIYVSADNRYRLFVNGAEVSSGPARGMPEHWRYETIDISPWLQKGKNVIAAEVFNLGEHRPVAQFSHKSAFLLQAEGKLGELLNTGKSNWRVIQNQAYSAIEVNREIIQDYYVAGPCDKIDGSKQIWGWETPDFDDSGRTTPKTIIRGVGRGYMHCVPWLLIPRTIPAMEQKLERIPKIVRSSGINPTGNFLTGTGNLSIPANVKVSILLDQTHLTKNSNRNSANNPCFFAVLGRYGARLLHAPR